LGGAGLLERFRRSLFERIALCLLGFGLLLGGEILPIGRRE